MTHSPSLRTRIAIITALGLMAWVGFVLLGYWVGYVVGWAVALLLKAVS